MSCRHSKRQPNVTNGLQSTLIFRNNLGILLLYTVNVCSHENKHVSWKLALIQFLTDWQLQRKLKRNPVHTFLAFLENTTSAANINFYLHFSACFAQSVDRNYLGRERKCIAEPSDKKPNYVVCSHWCLTLYLRTPKQ